MKEKIRTVQVGPLTFFTESFGNPKEYRPCLLIAGAMASARAWSDSFCRALAERGFFVIRYDHRDIGESSIVDWKTHTPYGLLELAEDALGF